MKAKKYETKNLYILHISELVYFVPDGETLYTPDTMYEKEYYTIAEKKSDERYKDLFNFCTTYKNNTHVGLGTIKDIEESISVDELTGFCISTMTKKEALLVLRNYLKELNPEENIEISAPIKYTKNLNLNLQTNEAK